MPTAAKLVGAICLAVLGWVVADLIKPLLPEGTQVGLFSPISAAWGFIVGWRFTGKRLGDGTGSSVGIGMGSIFLLGFWVLLSFSGYEMIRLSMRLRYDGPVEALQDMFQIGVDYLWTAATPEVIGTLLAGGLITGVVTGLAARRWN
ncbi:TrgA family protein [Aliiroseovarius sp.]|uniref:TrgA family protein n=1 Tax=Aliiroseovarius sp. TaxID=1872442 RepID=UPI003BABB166